MAGANQRFRWQRENLFPDFLPRQLPRLVATADGTGENRVAHDGHVRCVVRPRADDVGHAVFRVAGRFTVRDAQAAEHDEIVAPVAVLWRSAFGVRVQMNFGEAFANWLQARHVVLVRVRDEQMLELKLIFLDQLENGSGIPAGIEQCGVACDFIPNQIAMHGVAALGRADLPQLAPPAQILFRRQPAAGHAFEPGRIQPDEVRQRREIRSLADLSGGFKRGQFGFGNTRGTGCRCD